jgi:hypothetical protein
MNGVNGLASDHKAPRDLILRPTALEPGVYPSQDGKSDIVVIQHTSGRNYEMIWCKAGDANKYAQPGDTICPQAYIRNVETHYPADGPLVSEPAKAAPPSKPAKSKPKNPAAKKAKASPKKKR